MSQKLLSMVLVMGLPRSGKTETAKQIVERFHTIRGEQMEHHEIDMYVDPGSSKEFSFEKEYCSKANKRCLDHVEAALKNKTNVAISNCLLHPAHRNAYFELAIQMHVDVITIVHCHAKNQKDNYNFTPVTDDEWFGIPVVVFVNDIKYLIS